MSKWEKWGTEDCEEQEKSKEEKKGSDVNVMEREQEVEKGGVEGRKGEGNGGRTLLQTQTARSPQ